MKFYTPFQLDIEESNEFQKDFDERTKDLVIEDDVLIKYAQNYIESYCNTINQYFNEIKNYVSICINYPYRISIYRIGPNGVCFFYKPDETETISVYRPEDLDDSIESMNLFEVAKVFEPIFYKFDFRPREYSLKEAEIDGIKQALSSAFAFFWNAIDEKDFIELCDEVVLLENYKLLGEKRIEYKSFDEICEIKINEPAGFRRVEKWGFDYKHFRNNRITVKDIHRVEQLLRDSKNQIDIACLVTSGDITSIGSEISVENSRIRVWDRAVLENILHDNLELLSKYFSRYSNTVEKLEKSFQESKTKSKYSYFESQIRNCGYGRENFSNYEKIVTEVLSYLFEKDVGTPRVQERTIDEVHRRDTLYRNLRN